MEKVNSISQFGRDLEFFEAQKFIHSIKNSGILFVVGDRYEGRTTFLQSLRRKLFGEFDTFFFKWNIDDKADPLLIVYNYIIGKRLHHSSRRVWGKYYTLLSDYNLLRKRHRLFAKKKWFSEMKQKISRFFETESRSQERLPFWMIPKAQELDLFTLQSFLASFFDVNEKFITFVDDFELKEDNRNHLFLSSFVASDFNKFSTRLIISVSPSLNFAIAYNKLVKNANIPIKSIFLDPIPRRVNKNILEFRKSIDTPIIPGLINPLVAQNMAPEDLYNEITKAPYYTQITIASMNWENEMILFSSGLAWVFGQIAEQDFPRISSIMGIDASELRQSFNEHIFLHQIDGFWTFIEGWRYFLTGKHFQDSLINSVENYVCRLAKYCLQKSNFGDYIPNLDQGKTSSLSPATTNVFISIIEQIRRLTSHKKNPSSLVLSNETKTLFDKVAILAPSESVELIQLMKEIFSNTQILNILNFTLSLIKSRQSEVTEAEKEIIKFAFLTAKKWNDITLTEQAVDVAVDRQMHEKWTKEELLFITRVVLKNLSSEKIHKWTNFIAKRFYKLSLLSSNVTLLKEIYLKANCLDVLYGVLLKYKRSLQEYKINGGLIMEKLRAFIIHGHDKTLLLELKDYLQNVYGWPEPIVLMQRPGQGRTIIEKFEDESDNVDVVFALFTPDDLGGKAKDGLKSRARQNVIFELGYFVGHFGRKSGRVLVLKNGDLEMPSDIIGVEYIPIDDGIEKAGERIRKEVEHLEKINYEQDEQENGQEVRYLDEKGNH